MKEKELLQLTITNNTGGTIPVSILGQGNPDDIANAKTEYQWNISAAVYTNPILSIDVKPVGAASFQTITVPLLGNTPAAVVATLNALNIGSFWLDGANTIETYNDNFVYGKLSIGSASATFSMVIRRALIDVFPKVITLNGAGTISGSIDWGDGNVDLFSSAGPVALSHLYAVAGTYNVNVYITSSLPALTSIQAQNIRMLSIANLSALPSLNYLDLTGNQLSVIDVSANAALITLFLSTNNLALVNLLANSLLVNLRLDFNVLTTLDITGNPNLALVLINNNTLAVADINNALIFLVGGVVNGGTFNSLTQTPAAPPSGAGAAAKATLIAGPRLWTVTTD